jgi:uncharacterized repeat protein (TIGR03803 family)
MKKHYFLTLFLGIGLLNLTAQSPHFFGVTNTGSGNGLGTLFRTDTNGLNYSLIDTFDLEKIGTRPGAQELIEVRGKLYGVTPNGGNSNSGVLFEFTPSTGVYTIKHHFDDSTGKHPYCSLLLAANGKLYGTTTQGGSVNLGTLFEYNLTTNTLSRKINFDQTNLGSSPRGQMQETSTGIIYGVCERGGAYGNGVLYEYTIGTNVLINKDDFHSSINGVSPQGGLMKANNGKLYGMCYGGGDNSLGTLFEFDFVTDSLKKKYDFNLINGRSPHSNLIQASNGKLYGTTQYGGYSSGLGKGTLFEYDITLDTLKKLRAFGSTNLGYYPSGSLLEDSPGKFLINMRTGGPNSYSGTISEYTIATNYFVSKQYFDRLKTGAAPQGNLVKAVSTGKYYGVCNYGGTGDFGVLFEYDKTVDTLIKKKDFSPSPNGKKPSQNLLKASNGKLYGVTSGGGTGFGIIFEVDPITEVVTKKAEFNGMNGKNPVGILIEAVNGKIYGVTSRGGTTNNGTLFMFDIAISTITKLKDMKPIGAYPYGGLMKATNGKLYGTTTSGGTYGYGVLFEYNISTDTLIKRDNFGRGAGKSPYGRLLQATNGKLYGTTSYGGDYNKGVVYEFDIAIDSIKTLAIFNDTNGRTPHGGLIQTSTGKLFGMTTYGNSFGSTRSRGVIYEFDIVSNSIIHKVDFNRYTTGYGGSGELLEASNGKLYGMSSYSGSGTRGAVLFEFNPITNNFLLKTKLSGSANGSLIELTSPNSASIKENKISQILLVYPNPTSSILTIDTKGEKVLGIKIFNIRGQLIESKLKINNSIDVSHFKSELYIIQIETQNGIALSRFIKK